MQGSAGRAGGGEARERQTSGQHPALDLKFLQPDLFDHGRFLESLETVKQEHKDGKHPNRPENHSPITWGKPQLLLSSFMFL